MTSASGKKLVKTSIMTEFIRKKEVKKNWYKIDATNLIVGRLASEITKILRGKKKTSFTPNMDDGDFVIVTNARKLKFTGKKFSKKLLKFLKK